MTRGMVRLVCGALGVTAVWLAVRAAAAPGGRPVPPAPAVVQRQTAPTAPGTTVGADTIDYNFGTGRGECSGGVELVSPRVRMTAQKMTFQLDEQREVQWATARGDVVLIQKLDVHTSFRAEGEVADYRGSERRAILTGGVTIHYQSPDLAEPAVLRGSRGEMDLDNRVTIIHRTDAAPVTLVVKPRGNEGQPAPEPVEIRGDRVQITGGAKGSEYLVTGTPTITSGASTLRADRMRFQIDQADNQVESIHGEGNVVFDGKTTQGSQIHITGRNGVYQRLTHVVTVSGDVEATCLENGQQRPDRIAGEHLVYELKTENFSLKRGTRPVQAEFQQRPKREEPKPAPRGNR